MSKGPNIKKYVKKEHSEKSVLSHKGYALDRTTVSEELFKIIKEELTVKPNIMPDYDFGTQSFPVFRFNKTKIYLPKFYGLEKFGPVKNENKKERLGKDIKLKFKGSLRPDQEQFTKKVFKHLEKNDSCILNCPTGAGKTVMALSLLAQINKKTLIIVHKEFLMNQWIERINQFIPKARIGIIRGPKIEIKNKDIVIGMLQSISQKDYPKETFNSFHLTISDETHHICSKSFSQALFKISTIKMIGLSATPTRKDGLTKVLKWFLGDIIVKEHLTTRIETPSVKIVPAVYKEDPVPKYMMLPNGKKTVNSQNLINQLVEDSGRNKLIVEQILEQTVTGRKILLLSGRRQHCVDLKNMLEKKFKKQKLKKTVGLYIGLMKEKELNESNKCDVILATYGMASEGYDNSVLDTLIMVTGRSDIKQSVGRILRKKNEFPPLIIDIIDPQFCFNQTKTRTNYYKKEGFKIDDGSIKIPKKLNDKVIEFRDD